MHLARVCGNVVSSVKASGLVSHKLLLVEDVAADALTESEGGASNAYVAVDLAGAGDGEIVLVTRGSAARIVSGTSSVPTDASVIGIVDSVQYGGQITFVKR